jgi:hypothetical protein
MSEARRLRMTSNSLRFPWHRGPETRRTFLAAPSFGQGMVGPDAFDQTRFLGAARRSKRDPYRFELFGQHLDPEEKPVALVEIQGGTLLVTDRRVLQFQPHLDVHGAWNVKEFLGYSVHREWSRDGIVDVSRVTARSAGGRRGDIEDTIRLATSEGNADILVSRAPATTLSEEDFTILRDVILSGQAK